MVIGATVAAGIIIIARKDDLDRILGNVAPASGGNPVGGSTAAAGGPGLEPDQEPEDFDPDQNINIDNKIRKQMPKRGWSETDINNTIEKPHTTRSATNRANGNDATAYFNEDGSYVVRDNKTNQIIQISNRNDAGWVPDATIRNPYKP